MEIATTYSFSTTLPIPLSEADPKVRDALKAEGFGVISEIDMAAKLKEKIGVDYPPSITLGACNPNLAYQALDDNPDVALALPCNIVLREENGKTIVSALLPSVALKPFEGLKVHESAKTAEDNLSKVFDILSSS